MRRFLICVLLGTGAWAQNFSTFDNSANSTLNGAYFVRQVLLSDLNTTTSAVGRARSLTGTMTFDGNGKYSFSGQLMDSQAGGNPQAYTATGEYSVASNGMVQIRNPIDNKDFEYGGIGAVGPSAIIASDTEGPYQDVFVAIPQGSGLSNGSVQGTYRFGFIDFLNNNASQVRDGYFSATSTGSGSFGNLTVNGAMANLGSNNVTQTYNGVTYNITGGNGNGTITFPTASTPTSALLSGQKTVSLSSDGNLVLGGNPGGFDLIFGIKGVSNGTNSLYQGTYYTAALENFAGDLANGNNFVDSFYGSALALGQGTAIYHSRLQNFNRRASASCPACGAYNNTSDGFPNYNFGSDGIDSTNPDFQRILGAGGQGLILVGKGVLFSLQLVLQAKQSTGTGVFLDPLKIWNAASYAPITNAVAPGEFVSLFGSGLASSTLQAQSLPFPTNLGNVQVTVNGRPAPISYVSATQINVVVPYGTTEPYAYFQVTNSGTKSNTVMVNRATTAPGVFAVGQPPAVTQAAALHLDFSLVTQSNPAKAGEVLQLYVAGLGSVTPKVDDGAAASSTTFSFADDKTITVQLQDQTFQIYDTTVSFAGLAPGFAGLYQINFAVPRGVRSGLAWVNIATVDAYTSEAKIYIQ